ncbi:hypothetical protein MHYP_G00303730 [Metynnis hypsauchen]
MYNPARLHLRVDEQDFVQAYENVREKYKESKFSRPVPQCCSCMGAEERAINIGPVSDHRLDLHSVYSYAEEHVGL